MTDFSNLMLILMFILLLLSIGELKLIFLLISFQYIFSNLLMLVKSYYCFLLELLARAFWGKIKTRNSSFSELKLELLNILT